MPDIALPLLYTRATGLFRACCWSVIVMFPTCFSRVPNNAREAVKPLNHRNKSISSGPRRPEMHRKTEKTRNITLKVETGSLETACTTIQSPALPRLRGASLLDLAVPVSWPPLRPDAMAGRRPIGRKTRETGRASLLATFGGHNFSRRWPVVSDGRPRAGGGSAFKPEQAALLGPG